MKKERVIIYTDGAARGNPGPAGCGVALVTEKGETLKEFAKALGTMTNNEAEYEGVILALSSMKKVFGKKRLHDLDIEIRMDSELVARQLTGQYQIKEKNLAPYFVSIWNAQVKDFPKITFTHVPREENKKADALANRAIDEKEDTLL